MVGLLRDAIKRRGVRGSNGCAGTAAVQRPQHRWLSLPWAHWSLAMPTTGPLEPGVSPGRDHWIIVVPMMGLLELSVSLGRAVPYMCSHMYMTHAQLLTPGDHPSQTHLLWDNLTPHEPTMVPVPRTSRWMWWRW